MGHSSGMILEMRSQKPSNLDQNKPQTPPWCPCVASLNSIFCVADIVWYTGTRPEQSVFVW
jgi:hypothetical protein